MLKAIVYLSTDNHSNKDVSGINNNVFKRLYCLRYDQKLFLLKLSRFISVDQSLQYKQILIIHLSLGCTDMYRDLGIILDASTSMCYPTGPEDHGQEGAIRLLRQIVRVANFSPNGSHGALSTFADTNESIAYLKFNGEGLIYDPWNPIEGVFNQTVDTFNEVVIDKCLENDWCACRGGTDIISGLNFSLTNIFNTASGMRKDTSKVAVLINDGWDYQSNETYKNMGLEYDERDITLLVLEHITKCFNSLM